MLLYPPHLDPSRERPDLIGLRQPLCIIDQERQGLWTTSLSRIGKLRQIGFLIFPDRWPTMSTDVEFRLERAKIIDHARINKGWTKKQLAEKAGYDEKTLYNIGAGKDLQDKTIHDICQALEIAVPQQSEHHAGIADEMYGGYSRQLYSEYEGWFFVYRPSFTLKGQIYRYVMQIEWDSVESTYRFTAHYKVNKSEQKTIKTHSGPVYMSAITNLIHFVVTFRGSVRLITLTKMRHSDGVMRGSMLTHSEDINFYRPTLAPMVIKKLEKYEFEQQIYNDVRFLHENDEDYQFAHEQIGITQSKVLNMCFE